MRSISNAFKRELYNNNRRYICTADIRLSDNTELSITNAQIWQNGISWDDSVSEDSSFGALGSAIINSITVVVNNMNDSYSEYDFKDASVVLHIGLTIGNSDESIKIGTMRVDEASYNGSLISLYCLDNMSKFDKPYSESSIVYPATLQSIVTGACVDCGVVLGTTTFPNYNFTIANRPTDEALTYREVISYAAVLAGCFARCNADGELELKWFDRAALEEAENTIDGGIFDSATPYATGDNVNGGIFNPWNTGDVADGGLFTDVNNVHYLTALSSLDFSVDNVVITGIQIIVTTQTDAETTTNTHLYGTEDYSIKIENNPFINETNVDTIGSYLRNLLVGLTFRKASISHLSDPSIEAGDVALVWDRKGNIYPILVTSTNFNVSQKQQTISAADTPVKNSAVRYTEATKSFVASKTLIKQEKTLREQLEINLISALNAKAGMYETHIQEQGGGYTYYLHDKPVLADSKAVIKITNEAVGVTPNYQAQTPTWYGLTVDGNFIANIMSVIGIDFSWGTGGTLTLGGQNNVNGTLVMKDASNNTIGYWNNLGINAQAGSIGPWVINEKGIGVEKTMLDPEGITGNGVFIGSGLSVDYQFPGMSFESAESYVMVSTGGIYGRVKSGSAANSQHVEFYGLPVNDDEYIHSDLSCRSLTFTYHNDGSNPGLKELVHLGANQEGQYLPAAFGTLLLRDGSSNSIYPDTIEIDSRGPAIIFNGHSDVGILKNTYNNAVYNLIRNHNNGNISVSASGAGLYLGYENTTLVDFFNGALQITSNGIKGNNNQAGYPIITEKTGSSCISYMASATGYVLNVNALWGGSTYSTARVTLSTSDIRLKENIKDCTITALSLINAIRMREFDWREGRHQRIGLVADELEQLDDKLAIGGGYDADGEMNIKSVDTFYLMGYLVKSIQELSQKIKSLEAKINK